jgi:hypothetical protein
MRIVLPSQGWVYGLGGDPFIGRRIRSAQRIIVHFPLVMSKVRQRGFSKVAVTK